MKIVYNGCYGSFSLSRAAVLRAREISGNPEWGGPCIKGDKDSYGILHSDYGLLKNIERHDPVLVQVVEELGDAANGICANLCFYKVRKGAIYRIDEHDGNELVITLDENDWKMAQ